MSEPAETAVRALLRSAQLDGADGELRLTRVAHGGLDSAVASPGSHDWDLAAADLLVHEAGGVMTDFNGLALRYNQPHVVHRSLIAAGRPRHATLIDLVRDRQSEFA